jgi:tetratricopeptide (TPR) repeat protein
VKSLLTYPLFADHAVNSRTEDTQSDDELDSSELPSREQLEYLYAKVIRIPDCDEEKASVLSMLGGAYHVLYREESDGADLERAISLHENALRCTGPFCPQLVENAHDLSTTLMGRFEQSGDTVDIERAISYLQRALNLTEDVEMEPALLNNLGVAFQLRFDRLGDLSDVQNAISFNQRAVDMTTDGDLGKAARLCNLGDALESRFEHLGDLEDLEGAIQASEER